MLKVIRNKSFLRSAVSVCRKHQFLTLRSPNVLCRRIEITNKPTFLYSLTTKSFCTNKNDAEEVQDQSVVETDTTNEAQLPATVAVPEVWPHVPIIATRRNPIFPRFMKIVEVNILLYIYNYINLNLLSKIRAQINYYNFNIENYTDFINIIVITFFIIFLLTIISLLSLKFHF